MDIISLLQIIMMILIILIFILAIVYLYIIFKNKQKREINNQTNDVETNNKSKSTKSDLSKRSTFDFLEFDDIKDNMIIRKNRNQYVMVIECKGINYDLMSEEEKNSVEEGFTQFLNSLRHPVQLYVQTSTLNLRETIDQYKERLKDMQYSINSMKLQRQRAQEMENKKEFDKISFEIRRKENVLEYTTDIFEYIERLSKNKNVLQQKTYVIVSYYVSDLGKTESFSKEEIDNMCFSELYTRAQNVSRALSSAGVSGRILDSMELAELLYIAYNRDDEDIMQLSRVIEAQYDSLYNTGKDIVLKKQELLDEQIERESVDMATSAITEANKKLMEKEANKKKIIKEKALEIVEEYKDQMKNDLYEQTKKEILGEENSEETKTIVKKGRPKKQI